MTLPTGRTRSDTDRAFTLIELVLVMTLLVVVVAIAAPSLAGFFRGRALDAEARRLLSLTRQGQSRAAPGEEAKRPQPVQQQLEAK